MSEFTLYSYQCCPIRPNIPTDKRSQMFVEELEKVDKQAMENMTNHQALLDRILTTDLNRHFENQKETKKAGCYEKCLAFFYNNKRYFFKVLLPHPTIEAQDNVMGESCYMIRIANPKKTTREVNFVRMLQPDEPSALVIIDNRKDQQRILIEHTRAWKDTDAVRNILQACLGNVLRQHYNLGIRIEPVWQKNTFKNIIRAYGERIKMIDFDLGYPNMGRTGNNFLNPLKESLMNTYAAGTVRYTLPKPADLGIKKKKRKKGEQVNPEEEPRTSFIFDEENLDPVMMEMAEHCRANGRNTKFGLVDGHQVSLMKVPDAQLKRMTPELRKLYEQIGEVFSTYTAKMNDTVSTFDGQDDLFGGVASTVMEKLNELKAAGL